MTSSSGKPGCYNKRKNSGLSSDQRHRLTSTCCIPARWLSWTALGLMGLLKTILLPFLFIPVLQRSMKGTPQQSSASTIFSSFGELISAVVTRNHENEHLGSTFPSLSPTCSRSALSLRVSCGAAPPFKHDVLDRRRALSNWECLLFRILV